MFSKFFKKRQPLANPAPAPASTSPSSAPSPELAMAAEAAWATRLQACLGDDRALLALALETPSLQIKISAVTALVSEEVLRQAERDFRTQNKRVHRLAKERYQALVTERESRVRAGQLIAEAAALVGVATVPANRLVELDQAWQALEANALTDALRAEYASLSAQLTACLRERSEWQLAFSRWSVTSQAALLQLNATCAAVEAGSQPESTLVPAIEAVQAALAGKPVPAVASPASDDGKPLEENCRSALQRAAELPARLLEVAARQQAEQEAAAAAQRRSVESAEKKEKTQTSRASSPDLAGPLGEAEKALAGGHLAEARQHLLKIDRVLGEGKEKLAPGPALRTRLEAVQAEYARLRGWQHWGGGRVREDLVDEAEALACAVEPADEKPDGRPDARLNLKQHAEHIDQLRHRWKELDRLGGGGNALWPRFDAALKAAYVPLAEQQARLKAAREDNLAARIRLIEALDAMPVDPEGAAADWRELARGLEHFETEWRKLGPVEHTVPHKARDALLARRAASLARLESPLAAARAGAQAEREKIIARARALVADPRARDSLAKVRELQAEWQQHAKALPLARGVENALWAGFKAATDAVFQQRDAAVAAREAEGKAHQATREALIARLEGLSPATAAADIERTVTSTDREWRQAGEAPRQQSARLEERFRSARAAALQWVTEARLHAWQASCDALLDKLAQCETVEAERSEVSTDAVLLRLEIAADISSPPEFQPARREFKLQELKQALEGRSSSPAKADEVAPLLAEALGRRVTEAQRNRLRTVITTLRERPPGTIPGSV